MTKVAINGMGRIGRATLKIIMDEADLHLVAVNDIVPIEDMVYMLRYDSVYGRYPKNVEAKDGHLQIDGQEVDYLSVKNPSELPWEELGVDIIFECSGIFTDREALQNTSMPGPKG
ncbi:MAG: glyceraldehyde 3-phosphate dehydrogenase NAD-binding domain-containing protein [Owenweeksia sp.]|nr:glyceraldehyde 3-phosphate dehydrogenase NAD-binding domain-containing protein [Owenweeksia sp.]